MGAKASYVHGAPCRLWCVTCRSSQQGALDVWPHLCDKDTIVRHEVVEGAPFLLVLCQGLMWQVSKSGQSSPLQSSRLVVLSDFVWAPAWHAWLVHMIGLLSWFNLPCNKGGQVL